MRLPEQESFHKYVIAANTIAMQGLNLGLGLQSGTPFDMKAPDQSLKLEAA
jgi:hypothetical protein